VISRSARRFKKVGELQSLVNPAAGTIAPLLWLRSPSPWTMKASTAMNELRSIWTTIVRAAVSGFIGDNALSHAAAMAFYAATSLAPILLIVIAIAGMVVATTRRNWRCRPNLSAC